jgi:hypothetical protein
MEKAERLALIPSPCKGEDEGEGPCAERDYFIARDSGFCICIFASLAYYLCVIPTEAEGPGS